MSSWKRATEDASAQPLMRALIRPALAMTPEQKIAYVQAVVNKNIRWQSDATQWGQHDYWASAAQTLMAGVGDAEDRAIVKLQALKALGFKADDLFITMARDTIGGPMTVLSVRRGARFEILADTGTPFFASSRWREFKPLISLGNGKAWLHTTATSPSYVRKPVQTAAAAD